MIKLVVGLVVVAGFVGLLFALSRLGSGAEEESRAARLVASMRVERANAAAASMAATGATGIAVVAATVVEAAAATS